jgi:hypothetical protein
MHCAPFHWLSRHLQDVDDAALRSKWEHCKHAVQQESGLVRDLTRDRAAFGPPGTAKQPLRSPSVLPPASACPRNPLD